MRKAPLALDDAASPDASPVLVMLVSYVTHQIFLTQACSNRDRQTVV